MGGTLDVVVELQSVLNDLHRERKRFEELPEPMRALQVEHDQLRSEIDTLDAGLADSEIERRTAEGGAAEEQGKVEHYQAQTSKVTTQREYGALLAEIDGARQRKRELEDRALAALERHEGAQARLAELRQRFEEVDSQYQVELQAWEAEKPTLMDRVRHLEERAQNLRELLPDQARRLFEQLYERHQGDPLARVDRVERPGSGPTMWRCSVCNYSVRPQIVVEIQNQGELVTCDCGRQRIFFLAEVS